MKLKQISKRIYTLPFDDEKDRPVLGYIRGDRFSVAVDAGHSAEHVKDFYDAIRAIRLPLPSLTVITHWHWDHTFGMHAVEGQTMASRKTQAHLKEVAAAHSDDLQEYIKSLDGFVEAEYASGQPMVVVPADFTYEDSAQIDAGGVKIEIMEAVSPHTDDTTLVYIPDERTVFLGDAVMGDFRTGEVDADRMAQLILKVDSFSFRRAVLGHWPVRDKKQLLADLDARAFS